MFFGVKKIAIIPVISLFFALAIFLSPAFAANDNPTVPDAPTVPAAEKSTGNYGLNDTVKTGDLKTALIKDTPQEIVGRIIGAVLSLLGVIFFLLVIYGGLRWMIAQGNEGEVEKAKEILIAATIGLIIVLSAYAITSFIGNQLTGG
jgi:hypothetical protein